MQALIAIVSGLFGSVVSFFATYVSYKLAILVAVYAAFIAMTAALLVLFKALLLAVYITMPAEFQKGAQFLPGNLNLCITSLVSARIAVWLYKRKMYLLKFHATMN